MAHTRIIRGTKTGDILGYLEPNGRLTDVQGRTAIVQDYDEALATMRGWAWVV